MQAALHTGMASSSGSMCRDGIFQPTHVQEWRTSGTHSADFMTSDSPWLTAMSVLTKGSCWECDSSLVNNHCKRQYRMGYHPAPQWLCCGVAAVLGKDSSLPREQPLPLFSAQIKCLMAKGISSWAAAIRKFDWSYWPF